MGSVPDLLVNHVGDTVVQNSVRERDPSVVHPGRTIRQDRESQVGALKRWHRNVAQRWREDDIVRDDVVAENLSERIDVCSLKH